MSIHNPVAYRGTAEYLASCHARVPTFVDRHFRFPGAWHTNRPALGLDMLRAPVNLFWAPVYVAGQVIAHGAGRAGLARTARLLSRTPAGLRTRVQQHVAALIREELLMAPTVAPSPAPAGESSDEPPPTAAASGELAALVGESLEHYASTRTAAADVTNSLASTLAGAVAFKQFTPGGLAIGLLLAIHVARERAAASFPLGERLGEIYYGFFPPEPPLAAKVLAVGLTLCVLAMVASLSGMILDPLQSRIGLHQLRLHRMIDHLGEDLGADGGSRYRPRDALLARLLDTVDVVKSFFPFR